MSNLQRTILCTLLGSYIGWSVATIFITPMFKVDTNKVYIEQLEADKASQLVTIKKQDEFILFLRESIELRNHALKVKDELIKEIQK
jgi:hypothetical protein